MAWIQQIRKFTTAASLATRMVVPSFQRPGSTETILCHLFHHYEHKFRHLQGLVVIGSLPQVHHKESDMHISPSYEICLPAVNADGANSNDLNNSKSACGWYWIYRLRDMKCKECLQLWIQQRELLSRVLKPNNRVDLKY